MPAKVIFDTDPGVDDATALLFLHKHPAIELVGITTVFGNSDLGGVTRNALYLKARFGIDAPVARGAGHALERAAGPPPVFVHGDNGLGNVDLSGVPLGALDPRPAWQFIVETVRAHPGEITLLAVGRMTNLAQALAKAPDIAGLVRQVVVMGGAFATQGHNGNVTPVAEANIIGDPHAADIVFGADWPVVAVGLDVTKQVVVTAADLDRLAKSSSQAAQFVAQISRFYMAYHDRFGLDGFYLHDSSSVAYLIDPALFETSAGPVRVVTDGIAAGQTVQRPLGVWFPPGAWDNRPDQLACVAVKAAAVRDLLLNTLMS